MVIQMISSDFKDFLYNLFFFTYIKMSRDSSAEYYQNNKERLQKKSGENRIPLKEEKEKKQQHGHERYNI